MGCERKLPTGAVHFLASPIGLANCVLCGCGVIRVVVAWSRFSKLFMTDCSENITFWSAEIHFRFKIGSDIGEYDAIQAISKLRCIGALQNQKENS